MYVRPLGGRLLVHCVVGAFSSVCCELVGGSEIGLTDQLSFAGLATYVQSVKAFVLRYRTYGIDVWCADRRRRLCGLRVRIHPA